MSKVTKFFRHPVRFWLDTPTGRRLLPQYQRPTGTIVLDGGDHGVMVARYDPKKNFLYVRGAVSPDHAVVRIACLAANGAEIASTNCNPPKGDPIPDFPAFMQGADWFTLRKGKCFPDRALAKEPVTLIAYDADGQEKLRFSIPLRHKIRPQKRGVSGRDYHFVIDRFFYERQWGICSLGGGFYSKHGVQKIELFANGVSLGMADTGLHRPFSRLTLNPQNGFAFESRVEADLSQAHVYLDCTDGSGYRYRFSLPEKSLQRNPAAGVVYFNKRRAHLAQRAQIQKQQLLPKLRAGVIRAYKNTFLKRYLGVQDYGVMRVPASRVALFINNVNPGGRPEKWEYFLKLHHALAQQQAELVIVQMGRSAPIPDASPMRIINLHPRRAPLCYSIPKLLQRTGRTRAQLDIMLHEAAMLDYGYESNKYNKLVSWLDSLWHITRRTITMDVLMQELKPTTALIWHEWNPDSHVCKWLADGYGVPTLYCHDGALPMTMGIDAIGEMAESTPVAQAESYRALPISTQDLDQARRYIRMVVEQNLNRKSTVAEGNLANVLQPLRDAGKKILFFAGTNDWQTGMLPVWWDKSTIHSPAFVDTYDTLAYLRDLCRARGWVLLFKPHPHLEPPRLDLSDPHVIFVREANIHECVRLSDACLTLASATAYMALMNDCPTVMLGRNSLSAADCTYNIHTTGDVERVVEMALAKQGFDQHREGFVDHVARMLRYTLHPMHQDSIPWLHRTYEDTARLLVKSGGFSPQLHAYESSI